MSFSKKYSEKRAKKDSEFKNLHEDQKNAESLELRAQLIDLRLKLGLTQKEFAELVHVKQPLISRLENGHQNITIKTLQQILSRTNTGAKLKIEVNDEELITH